jgi:hypothetical protein
MGAADHRRTRMPPRWDPVNEGERPVRVAERRFWASNREREAARAGSPGSMAGSDRCRREEAPPGLTSKLA